MKLNRTLFASVGGLGLALTLAACGDDTDQVEPLDTEVDAIAVADFDPMTRDYTLNPEQQQARDAYDMDAMQEEYSGYREGTGEGSAGGEPAAGPDAAATEASSDMPERSEMTWEYLDRNDDGQLSVAEYAIWAVPVDPNEPKPNDQTKPFLTSDQANKAADSFFYYDRDGNTYLSQDEFRAARTGETLV